MEAELLGERYREYSCIGGLASSNRCSLFATYIGVTYPVVEQSHVSFVAHVGGSITTTSLFALAHFLRITCLLACCLPIVDYLSSSCILCPSLNLP